MNNKTVGIVLNTVHKYVQDVMNLLKLSIFHVSKICLDRILELFRQFGFFGFPVFYC
jgi:aspartate/glutamate racemase